MNTTEIKPVEFYTNQIASGLLKRKNELYYKNNPELFLENFGKAWSKQKEIVRSVFENKITLVKSANGTGKSYVAAAVAWAFHYIHGPDCCIVTTAKTSKALQFTLWSRIRRLYVDIRHLYNDADINQLDFTPNQLTYPDWYMVGLNPKIEGGEAVAFQGHHAKHVLFLVDEAVLTDPAIFEAIEGSMTAGDARLLAIWNPTTKQGYVYQNYEKKKKGNLITISAWDLFDSPEFKEDPEYFSALVNPAGAQDMIDRYGRNHPLVKARLDAQYPKEDKTSAVSYNDYQTCIMNYGKYCKEPIEWSDVIFGWDIAETGDENSIKRLRKGTLKSDDRTIIEITDVSGVENWKGDPKSNLGYVKEIIVNEMALPEYEYYEEKTKEQQDFNLEAPKKLVKFHLIYDGVGIGSYAGSFMKDQIKSLKITKFMAGSSAKPIQKYKDETILNAISEAWYYTSKLVSGEQEESWGTVCISMSDQTEEELTTRQKKRGAKNKEDFVWYIEPKPDYKKRSGGKSPDNADAVVMSIYELMNGGKSVILTGFIS